MIINKRIQKSLESSSSHKVVRCKDSLFQMLEKPVLKPGHGEVLIRNAFSTGNPYDGILFMEKGEGNYHWLRGVWHHHRRRRACRPRSSQLTFFHDGWTQYNVSD